jgi:RNA:NAD 2'-phosphotransferase (TPT1/KptA family)
LQPGSSLFPLLYPTLGKIRLLVIRHFSKEIILATDRHGYSRIRTSVNAPLSYP